MVDTDLERIYTIPLREPKQGKRSHRAPRALGEIRRYLQRHMKSDNVWIDAAVNEKLWERGKFKIPSKIRVRAIRFVDGVVEVSLPEEEATSLREQLKAKRDEAASKAILAPAEGAEEVEEGEPKAGEGPTTEGKPTEAETTEKKAEDVREAPEQKGKGKEAGGES